MKVATDRRARENLAKREAINEKVLVLSLFLCASRLSLIDCYSYASYHSFHTDL